MAAVSEKPRTKPAGGGKTLAPARKPARDTAAGKAFKPSPRGGASPVRKAKAKAAKSVARKAVSPSSKTGGLARKAAFALLARASKRLAGSGAAVTRTASERALDAAETATSPGTHRRPPIQVGLDIAVPLRVAWSEWMALEWVPDVAGEITDVKPGRNGALRGHLPGGDRWTAEVSEQRDRHSFAWRSTRGSDCAGLITFHSLSDSLTRVELSLDARPLQLGQALGLATRHADRRIAAELRRFKARLELISPDDYGDDD